LAGIAALVAIGWWSAGMQFRRTDAWASPGPVAAVHSTWANDCNACHTDFKPIRDDALLISGEARSIADEKCQKCHPVAHKDDPLGPFGHHALNTSIAEFGCATCHHEHRGTSQSLVRAADNTCMTCHARNDLGKFAAGTPAIADIKPVTQFSASGHPYFRSLGDPELGPAAPTPYPRQLKFARFSHHLHMTPGMAQDGDHQAVWTLGQIAEADRPRYAKKGQALSEPVQLDCGSCHQSESEGHEQTKTDGSADEVSAANSSGAYMLPVTYDNQCRACHALTFEPCGEAAGGSAPRETSKSCDTVPHRLSAAKLAEELEKYWQDRYFKDHPTELNRLLPLPGSRQEPGSQSASDWVEEHCRQSASHLNRVCSKCHQFSDENSHQRPVSADAMVDAIIPRVAPVEIPEKLLAHAQFNHLAHRAVECISCHQDAYPTKASGDKLEEPADSEPKQSSLMIANRDKCLECHSPRQENGAAPRGGARFDCAECHRYHDRDEATSEISGSRPR
jgi:hypothetical protein